jgi:UDP-glucose 4-epimerase
VRVVVTGATGNVGTSVLAVLQQAPEVTSVVGVARRVHDRLPFHGVEWHRADVGRSSLDTVLAGSDALIHLAWAIQPSHDEAALWRTNVLGTRAVLDSAARAGVRTVLYASSIGAYGEGPKDRPVDESWPVEGTPSSYYGRHKASVEWFLDGFEAANPEMRVVRLRPSLIFKPEAATEIRRLFIGNLVPRRLFRRDVLPGFPDPGLVFQATHTDDVARAYLLALLSDARGAFNIAADPVLDVQVVARLLEAEPFAVPLRLARLGAAASWRARLQPTAPGWIDMAARVPVMDSSRAIRELGWVPATTATDALAGLLDGLRDGTDFPTPPLARASIPIRR